MMNEFEAEVQKWKGVIERHPEIYLGNTNDLAVIPKEILESLKQYFPQIEELMKPKKKERRVVLMSKFSPVPFAEEILEDHRIVYDKNSILWRYDSDDGVWKPKAEQFIKTLARRRLLGEEQQKKNYVDEIVKHLQDITYDDLFELDNNPYLIGFRNGVYNLQTGEMEDFSPDHKITNKLNLEIDEDFKECPNIDKFFADSIGEEYKDILYDLFAYCLFKRYPYQKLFFIYGPAHTGKSIVLELLEKFLGEDNFCSVEPQDIQKDVHATAQMQFKMANIVSDINYDSLDNINQVKKITGGDTVKIRNMYKEPYNTKLFTKQIFSTNKLPIVKEKTRAWYRRVYTIEFSNIVQKDKVDRFLMDKLATPEELKGLAYKCLQQLKGLKNNNFVFTYDIDEKVMQEVYEKLSNPLLLFTSDNCVVQDKSFVFQWEFKERLKNWLQWNHFPPLSNSEIKDYMQERYTNSNRAVLGTEKVHRVWSGLGWKSSHNPQNLTESNSFNLFNQVGKKVYVYRGCFAEPCKSVKSVKNGKIDKNDFLKAGFNETFANEMLEENKNEKTQKSEK